MAKVENVKKTCIRICIACTGIGKYVRDELIIIIVITTAPAIVVIVTIGHVVVCAYRVL